MLFGFTAFFFGLYGYRGITRGLVFQVVGTVIGAALVTGIRALMGLESIGAFLFTEPAWVFGALVGVVSFFFGVGVMTDWVKWARGSTRPTIMKTSRVGKNTLAYRWITKSSAFNIPSQRCSSSRLAVLLR
ncbi:MAG: hypothetical protein IPM31_17845 [Anaerolineae bacterium]|nr:hypothetical protein [Anaerolineae bacterium]